MSLQKSKSNHKHSASSQNGQNYNKSNNKKCKKYFMIDANTKIYFNADFDSGNLQKVQQISPYIYKLYPGYDKVSLGTEKTYFHFKVFGFKLCTVRFHITRVHILQKLLKTGQQESYKPIVRKGKGKYQKIQKGVKIYYNKSDEAELSIQYEFQQQNQWVQFSFSYPYSYEDLLNLVKQLKIKYVDHPQIYFHEEVLCYSQEGRKLKMINITEKINCDKSRQELVTGLFPTHQNNNSKTPNKNQVRAFKINKPKVVISGRVHPGQTPASYCVQGLIRFLLDEKDYRAYLLRKNFHFIIIPMLNPDGVYHGMFRNDLNGQNLNRLYLNCNPTKHPTIWGFTQYLKYLKEGENPVLFYFDFHSHPSKKQFFIYGNAFPQFTHQIQAETFGRLLQNNCPYFHNIDSIFTQKQMTSKDKYDTFSKQGCARVYVHRLFGIIHSYTVQCGYFAPGKLQKWQQMQVIKKRAQILTKQYTYVGDWQNCSKNTYIPESYMLMGKSIAITILDLFHLNPYTRITINELRSIGTIRKSVGVNIYNSVERFRMIDSNASKKLKQLNKIIEEQYYKVKVGTYGLSISQNYGMKYRKRTFSLLSRVYQTKNQSISRIKILSNQKAGIEGIEKSQTLNEQIELQQYPQMFQLEDVENETEANVILNKNRQQLNLMTLNLVQQSKKFKQYKAQLQLKIQQNHKSFGNINKLEEKQMNEASNDCLHVSHLISTKKLPYINQSVPINQKMKDLYNIKQSINHSQVKEGHIYRIASGRANEKERQCRELIEKDIVLISRRVDSQKNLQKIHLNVPKHSKKSSSIIQSKIGLHQNSVASIPIRPQRSQSRQQLSKSDLKQLRIDTFLKKQNSSLPKKKQASDLEKLIGEKINQHGKSSNNQISSVSRFPAIYARNIEHHLKVKN